MIKVPPEFRPKELRPYPPDNHLPFEDWFFQNYDTSRNNSDRLYLPVQWTAYYCNNRHGRNIKALNKLQEYLNTLDRSKKYFTVVQYDDGILNRHKLDIKVFGTGCKGDVQLPLVCQPHPYEFKENGRPIFASFIGKITHPIRKQLLDLQDKQGYFISTEDTGLYTYCYIMSQSKYVLCPRGYGKTSFRIMEALQYGATPVYISDEFLFDEGCVCLKNLDDFFKLDHYFPENLWAYYNKETFQKQYTYEAAANIIYENL